MWSSQEMSRSVMGSSDLAESYQYRPPSLRWSQLTTFSGMILGTTRFGALACAPGWTGEGLACAAARPSNAVLTLASSSRISQRPRIITPRSSAYSSPALIISATLGLRRMLTTFWALPVRGHVERAVPCEAVHGDHILAFPEERALLV